MTTEDGAVAVGGLILLTADFWGHVVYWIPEGLKFVGLVATAVYLVVRAVNETRKLMRK